ncbi:hypothetical protein EON63_03115 [archaeon]|nr:MAG: hypothetical protein EON63_03115 [archaeon]
MVGITSAFVGAEGNSELLKLETLTPLPTITTQDILKHEKYAPYTIQHTTYTIHHTPRPRHCQTPYSNCFIYYL